MTLVKIDDKLFNATVSLQRRTETVDNVGDSSETISTLITGIRISIQPIKINEYKANQGLDYKGIYHMYTNADKFSLIEPENQDYFLDENSGVRYQIIEVMKNLTNSAFHHYKFIGKKQEVNS